jgi:oligopeptide/dipeptide ABC transporter ATP-binding protein
MLAVENLTKYFDVSRSATDVAARRRPRLVALDGVSFELQPHAALGIVGESGSGKSTLAKCLVRLERPDGGRVMFRDKDVVVAGAKELAAIRRAVQLIYQDPYSSLNPLMTVGQAVAEPAIVHGIADRGRAAENYVAEMLELVGLSPTLAKRRPRQLSGGQRQRVAIARAMAVQPEVLIADEPVSALDVSIQAQILALFAKLRSEQGVAIILIAHQLNVVAHLADDVAVMYLGRVVERGPAHTVFTHASHPYTRALLESQPGRHRRGGRAQPALVGEIPSPLNVPSGCRFRTRCPIAQRICHEVDPPPADLGGGHQSWCHFPNEIAPSANGNDPNAAARATLTDRLST